MYIPTSQPIHAHTERSDYMQDCTFFDIKIFVGGGGGTQLSVLLMCHGTCAITAFSGAKET